MLIYGFMTLTLTWIEDIHSYHNAKQHFVKFQTDRTETDDENQIQIFDVQEPITITLRNHEIAPNGRCSQLSDRGNGDFCDDDT